MSLFPTPEEQAYSRACLEAGRIRADMEALRAELHRRGGLRRIAQTIALAAHAQRIHLGGFDVGYYEGLDEYRRRSRDEERQGRVIRAVSLWGALAMVQWSAYKIGHRDGATAVHAEWMSDVTTSGGPR